MSRSTQLATELQGGCDLCGATPEPVYRAADTARDADVCVCLSCGLVQTVYGGREEGRHAPSTSSGAGWGNIRHGKGLRLDAVKEILATKLDWSTIHDVLDVGSNRGDFAHWLFEHASTSDLIAIEPDCHIVESYKTDDRIDLRVARFEHVNLPPTSIDLAFCFHTLEHAASALNMLQQIRDALRPDGRLFLEVPNLALIDDPHIAEDFFIDKHSFHFDSASMLDLLAVAGFVPEWGPLDDDSNITVIARRAEPTTVALCPERAARHIDLIERYAHHLAENREALVGIAERIGELAARQRTAVWGAGRLFDALIRFGGLDPSALLVIDEYLARHLDTIHGVPVQRSDVLRRDPPQVVFVLAKSSAADITQRIRSFGIKNVVTYQDLLSAN